MVKCEINGLLLVYHLNKKNAKGSNFMTTVMKKNNILQAYSSCLFSSSISYGLHFEIAINISY